MAISLIVEPSRQLNQNVRLILDRTDGEYLEKGAMAGGLVIVDRAREIVHIRTGDLQSTIRVIPGKNAKGTNDPRGVSTVIITAGGTSPRSGNDVNYAGFVEFGTSRMQAFPYLRPAIDMYKEQALIATGDAVIRNIFDPHLNKRTVDISLPRRTR